MTEHERYRLERELIEASRHLEILQLEYRIASRVTERLDGQINIMNAKVENIRKKLTPEEGE